MPETPGRAVTAPTPAAEDGWPLTQRTRPTICCQRMRRLETSPGDERPRHPYIQRIPAEFMLAPDGPAHQHQ